MHSLEYTVYEFSTQKKAKHTVRKVLKVCSELRTLPTDFRNIAQNVLHLSNVVRYFENVCEFCVTSNIIKMD